MKKLRKQAIEIKVPKQIYDNSILVANKYFSKTKKNETKY